MLFQIRSSLRGCRCHVMQFAREVYSLSKVRNCFRNCLHFCHFRAGGISCYEPTESVKYLHTDWLFKKVSFVKCKQLIIFVCSKRPPITKSSISSPCHKKEMRIRCLISIHPHQMNQPWIFSRDFGTSSNVFDCEVKKGSIEKK